MKLTDWTSRFWKALAPLGQTSGYSQHESFRIFLHAAFLTLRGVRLKVDGDAKAFEANEDAYRKLWARMLNPQVCARACAEAFGVTTEALEDLRCDFLGPCLMEAGGNAAAGQFFTPSALCDLMAEMTMADAVFPETGEVTILEPAVGAGATLIALIPFLEKRGIGTSRVRMEAWDIDEKCVWATYVQTTLLGIPCVVVHGNTLTQEVWGRHHNLLMSPMVRATLALDRVLRSPPEPVVVKKPPRTAAVITPPT